MAIADFLLQGKKEVTLAYFNHGTIHGQEAQEFLVSRAKELNVELILGSIVSEKTKEESWEEYWRNQRYMFFKSFANQEVVTCHHLDDSVESWIFSSLHGKGKLIPYRNGNVIRPFLLTKKSDLLKWVLDRKIPYIEDPSNSDTSYSRNLIRHIIVPQALKVNPGLHKTVSKLIEADLVPV